MTTLDRCPSELTPDELAATWTDNDPETCAQVNGTRRAFNYSTRGANAGPSPKYRKSAPEVYAATVAQLLKPTAADRAYWAAHPVTVHAKPAHLNLQRIRATKHSPSGYWVTRLESVELYRKIVAQRRQRLAARVEEYGLTFAPSLLIHWTLEVAPIPQVITRNAAIAA